MILITKSCVREKSRKLEVSSALDMSQRYGHKDRQTDRQTHKDRQTERQTEGCMDGQTDRLKSRRKNRQTD